MPYISDPIWIFSNRNPAGGPGFDKTLTAEANCSSLHQHGCTELKADWRTMEGRKDIHQAQWSLFCLTPCLNMKASWKK